jgi:hypothetical protein
MSNSASEKVLQLLHATVAEALGKALKEEPSPQMLAQAIKFLKDNGIEPARDTDNTALNALADTINSIEDEGDPDAIRDLIN